MAMVLKPIGETGLIGLDPVPWYHDGFRSLSVRALEGVPSDDESVIRRAIVLGVLACGRIDGLSQALNRELQPLGYSARLEWNNVQRDVVLVEITTSA